MRIQQQSDLQCRSRCKAKTQVTPAHESSVASVPAITFTHEERQRALELQLLSFLDEAEGVSQAWGAIGFPPGAYKPFWKDHPLDRLQEIWTTLRAAEAKYKTEDARQIRSI